MLSQETINDHHSGVLGVYYKREIPGTHISLEDLHREKRTQRNSISADFPIGSIGTLSGRGPMISDSNTEFSSQEICARLAYNRSYVGRSITDTIGDLGFYKHQVLVGRQMFQNDSCLVMHDPGTGKTMTHLYVMMELLKAGVIKNFVIINQSQNGNNVAMIALNALYERIYISHYGIPFKQFQGKYVHAMTLYEVGSYNYQSHTGIVIDEAHNLLSDNEPGVTKRKVERVALFVDKINHLEGIKLLLLSATPLLGDVASLGKFRSILYRNKEETMNFIPSSLISYTQISYLHLNIIQQMNPDYPGVGDRSFELTNGRTYEFKLYCSKPMPMQIADFAKLANRKKNAPFQSEIKPRIVSSLPHKTIEVIDGKEVEITREQSAIAEKIIKLIEKTIDGTIIIYCDLVGDGAKAMARYLDRHGYEAYTKRDSVTTTSRNEVARNPQVESARIHELETELAIRHRALRSLRIRLSQTSEDELKILMEQIEIYEELSEDESYQDVLDSMLLYVNDYETHHLDNTEITEHIQQLESEIEELQGQLDELLPKNSGGKKGGNGSRRYLLYLSDMDIKAKKAFRSVFNSPDNWDGSLIKVVIGSRVMRDGVDIHHAVQTHIIIPEWRIPGYIQAQHRGIRSSGHAWLIHHRAIKLVEKERSDRSIPLADKKTYQQAKKEKVNVEIFNHLVDMTLLNIDDIRAAREFINETDELACMSDEEILVLLISNGTKNRAGEAIIDAAVKSYESVGAEMMTLRSRSLDYKLNVRKEARVRDALTPEEVVRQKKFYTETDLLAKKDTELFFMKDNVDVICSHIIEMLLDECYKNTDEIFRLLMVPPPIIKILENHGKTPEQLFDDLGASREFIDILLTNRGNRDEKQLVEEITRAHPFIGALLSNEYKDRKITRAIEDISNDLASLENYTGPPTEQMIATAIIELVRFRVRIYHRYFGIELYVKLYETDTESILYLCTTRNEIPHTVVAPKYDEVLLESAERVVRPAEAAYDGSARMIHPYIAATRNIGYSTNRHIERPITHITKEDLEIGVRSNLFHKLQDVIKKALEGGDINMRDLRFLSQMNNYWAFSWYDLELHQKNPLDTQQMSVYVFEGHISRPDMNVLAHDLKVHGYSTSSKRWVATSVDKIKKTLLVRYAVLVELYNNFSFFDIPEFSHYYTGLFSGDIVKTNGIILVKDHYEPLDSSLTEVGSVNEYVSNLFTNSISGDRLGAKFLVKRFLKSNAKGSQIGGELSASRNDKNAIKTLIEKIIDEGIVLPFFLYGKDETIIEGTTTIIDIKLAELREMKQAIAGIPTLRFQIYAMETQIHDPERKKTIYQRIYKLPAFLACTQ